MNWQEVVESPYLQNLPFKIELNEFGQVVMNPVKINHSFFQSRITILLDKLRPEGIVLTECAIWTPKGTKCADVAWATPETFAQIGGKTEAQIAPEVCVEVTSMRNTAKEMKQKRKLYFEQGAAEVWLCDEYGSLKFYNAAGLLEQSVMFPDFPKKIGIR